MFFVSLVLPNVTISVAVDEINNDGYNADDDDEFNNNNVNEPKENNEIISSSSSSFSSSSLSIKTTNITYSTIRSTNRNNNNNNKRNSNNNKKNMFIIKEGHRLTLNCNVISNPEPFKIRWLRNRKELQQSNTNMKGKIR